jgi:hypothetical protein
MDPHSGGLSIVATLRPLCPTPGFCGPLGSAGPSADLSEPQSVLLSPPEASPEVILQPLEKTGNKKAYQSHTAERKMEHIPFLLHLQVMIDICDAVDLNKKQKLIGPRKPKYSPSPVHRLESTSNILLDGFPGEFLVSKQYSQHCRTLINVLSAAVSPPLGPRYTLDTR